MLKRPLSSCCSSCRKAKRPAQQRQHHLYLVLDDWERGYSIHKVDVAAFDTDAVDHLDCDDDGGDGSGVPPVVRVEAKHGFSRFFAAHGSKILAMFPVSSSPGVPVFDTESSGVSVYPRPPSYGRLGFPLFASLRGIFFKISASSVEMLGLQPPAMDAAADEPWAWHDITAYAEPPFDVHQAVCHALHPDGRALFVSVPIDVTSPRCETTEHTFSLDAAGEDLEWTHRGEWMLPFKGQAYYDAGLDAWVGLCRHREGLGHVCSCDLAPPLSASGVSPPRWKLCGERLFCPDGERHRGAKLVHMGSSRFCLVEVVAHRDDKRGYPIRRVLRMTTFGLRYGKNGELEIAGRMARSSKPYTVANKGLVDLSIEPVAFWL